MVKDVYINPETKKPVKVEGKIYVLAGATGGGKSTWIKDRIKKIPLKKEIFDLDNEYHEFGTKPIDRSVLSATELRKEFKKRIAPMWERVMVFSEAQLFIDHSTLDDEILEIISGARRRGNFVFFDFHGLSQVNIGLLRYFNYLILKKHTVETMAQLKKFMHYPAIKKSLISVQADKNQYAERIIERKDLLLDLK